jgi:hypothetical protein
MSTRSDIHHPVFLMHLQTFLVLCSIVGHGTSAPLIMLARTVQMSDPLARLFGTSKPAASSTAVSDERTPLLVDIPGASAARASEHISGRAYTAMGDPDEPHHRSQVCRDLRAGHDDDDGIAVHGELSSDV